MKMNKPRLLERFLRYVQVDTAADPGADCYPSSQGQWELGRILLTELKELGLDQVNQDEHGLVTAVVPGNVVGAPVVVLNSHLDMTNPGCALQIASQLELLGHPLPVRHVVEVVDASIRGLTIEQLASDRD